MDHGSKVKAVKGVAWTTAANWGCQFLSFCFFSFLARLLNPRTFGVVALASVYIAFVQIFVTQGFGMAIIQRRDLDEEHLDSAFWIAVATALLFCFLSIMLADQTARFFKEPGVAPVIQWLSLTVVLSALCSVQSAILMREMNFRPLAIRSLAATAASGVVGVTMAFLGCGVWSLVGQQLVNAALGCVFLWFAVPWRPRLVVSRRHLRDLYGFSLNLTGNDILWFFSQKSDQTIVGYGFGASGLGPYSLASKVIALAYDGVVASLQRVAFPAFSNLQSDAAEFESSLHRFCEMSSFLCLPFFAGIGAIAPELVPLLFGSKWVAAVPILQILSAYGALRVILAYMHPLMLAKGRTGSYLALNVLLSALTLLGCLIGLRWNAAVIADSMVVSLFTFFVVFLFVAQKSLDVRAVPLLRSFAFPTLFTLVMTAGVCLLGPFVAKSVTPVGALAILVVVGIVIYTSTAYLLRPDLLKSIVRLAAGSLISPRANQIDDIHPGSGVIVGFEAERSETETEVLR